MKTIPLSVPYLKGNEWKYIKDCLDTNWVSSVGKYVDTFESELASYVGAKYGVATVNGTAAIHTALRVLGVGPGDKVLVPSLTFIASVNPIVYCGAKPIFVDSEKETYNIDPKKIKETVEKMVSKNEKPKAIIIVHLYGHSVEIDPIIELCKKYNIFLIEDATEALGSEYKGKKLGGIGDIGCFSFNGNKMITTGGGGMLVTNREEFCERAKYLTTQAKDDPVNFIHEEIGFNYRLTNIQAAMGLAQLEKIEMFIERKREIANQYNALFKNIPGILVPPEKEWGLNNFWLYSILINERQFGASSKFLLNALNKEGIQTRPFFKPIHLMPMYYTGKKYEIAEELWEKGLNLPCSVGISETEIKIVAKKVIDIGGL